MQQNQALQNRECCRTKICIYNRQLTARDNARKGMLEDLKRLNNNFSDLIADRLVWFFAEPGISS